MASSVDIRLSHDRLKGRTFLLGNKRAFSLSLPAACGHSDACLHPHKWFGAYLYGRKFLEGQLVRVRADRTHLLSARNQTELVLGSVSARREYEVDGAVCSEEIFVPDGIQGFAGTFHGDLEFIVEPEFDMRFYRALNQSVDGYEVEVDERGAVVSNLLPAGTYDDATEAFIPSEEDGEGIRVFAAVEVLGGDGRAHRLPRRSWRRRKVFVKDRRRHQAIAASAPDDSALDHAPLWNESHSVVCAPVRLHFHGGATVVYGFGSSREEALEQLATLRDNLVAFEVQKAGTAADMLDRARFETGAQRVDTAYGQVLTRLMDALVARHATAEDTALDRPATMILAGNQYFHDSWKRDENIALGFLLALGYYDLARDVIRDTWQLQDPLTGRLPQRIRAGEEPPYHSSDGTLWALWRLLQYWRCTGDESLLYEKLPMVEHFFRRSLGCTVQGMLPSGRTHTPDYLWETWMDTPHTPRDGFPVEIQMLWISCLRHYRPILKGRDPRLEAAMGAVESDAWLSLQRFNVRGMPADSMDSGGQVRDLITPNPYFCFGVGLDLGQEVEGAMRDMGRRQLAGQGGIITLAPQDWDRVFSADFLSNRRHVRGRRMRSVGKFNYHRGVEWNWLSQFFVQAELKYGEADTAFRKYLRPQVDMALEQAGIGGISELFDLAGARGPEYQAWSMSGFLEALHAFAGVQVDVPNAHISIEPQIPRGWDHVDVRKWYGSVPFDVRYNGDAETRSLDITFPGGAPPSIDVDVGLVLPARHVASYVALRLDGVPRTPGLSLEPVPGSDRARLRCRVPAGSRIEMQVGLKRSWGRVQRPA